MAKANPIEIQKHLKGMDYPASKKEIIDHAGKQGIAEDLKEVLEQLPDEDYETPAEVSKAIGQLQ